MNRCDNGHEVPEGTLRCPLCGAAIAGVGGAEAFPGWGDEPPTVPSPVADPTVAGLEGPSRLTGPWSDDPWATAAGAGPAGAAPGQGALREELPWEARAWEEPPRRGKRTLLTVLVIVVAIAVVGGVVAALLLSRGHGHGSRSATAPTTVAGGALTPGSTASTAPSAAPNTAQTTVPGGAVTSVPGGGVTTTAPGSPAQAMQTLGGYLAQTAGVRKNVQTAVAGVQGCTIPPATGSQTLQGAISTRQQVLAALPSINVASLPNGTQLVSALTQALQQSITADQGYQAWMSDIGAGKLACNADPSGDAGFQQGQAASASATASKTSFTTLWDPLATEYGQPTYQPADL